MARLIYSFSVSLDGFMESRNRDLEWVDIDEELHRFFNDECRDEGAFLYGRRLYELMAAFWPTADELPGAPDYVADFARIWRAKPKVVFSNTLDSVAWNSRLVRGDAGTEIARLKAEPGADLSIGGANLASTAIRLGLVDEYQLVVHPVVLGGGTRFFPPLDERLDLRLVETRRFRSGAVLLRYQPAGRN